MKKFLIALIIVLLTSIAWSLPADLNHDGVVDFVDFATFAEEWLMTDNIPWSDGGEDTPTLIVTFSDWIQPESMPWPPYSQLINGYPYGLPFAGKSYDAPETYEGMYYEWSIGSQDFPDYTPYILVRVYPFGTPDEDLLPIPFTMLQVSTGYATMFFSIVPGICVTDFNQPYINGAYGGSGHVTQEE